MSWQKQDCQPGDLHSSMERLKEAAQQKQEESIRHLHSSMERLKVMFDSL